MGPQDKKTGETHRVPPVPVSRGSDVGLDPEVRGVFFEEVHLVEIDRQLDLLVDADGALGVDGGDEIVITGVEVEVGLRTQGFDDVHLRLDHVPLDPVRRVGQVVPPGFLIFDKVLLSRSKYRGAVFACQGILCNTL